VARSLQWCPQTIFDRLASKQFRLIHKIDSAACWDSLSTIAPNLIELLRYVASVKTTASEVDRRCGNCIAFMLSQLGSDCPPACLVRRATDRSFQSPFGHFCVIFIAFRTSLSGVLLPCWSAMHWRYSARSCVLCLTFCRRRFHSLSTDSHRIFYMLIVFSFLVFPLIFWLIDWLIDDVVVCAVETIHTDTRQPFVSLHRCNH